MKPFATIAIDYIGGDYKVVLNTGKAVCVAQSWDQCRKIAADANAAHEKAVREAVEAFRERAAKAIASIPCGESLYASSAETHAAMTAYDRAEEAIRALPAVEENS